jgi:hypothetical protein
MLSPNFKVSEHGSFVLVCHVFADQGLKLTLAQIRRSVSHDITTVNMAEIHKVISMFHFSLCAESCVLILGTSIRVKFHIAVRDIHIDVESCIGIWNLGYMVTFTFTCFYYLHFYYKLSWILQY